MIVEIRMARSWQVWVDGRKSDREWAIGEAERGEISGRTAFKYEIDGLVIDGREIQMIAFDVPAEEWIVDSNGKRSGPTEGWIGFAGCAPTPLAITGCWYLTGWADSITKGARTESGEWVEIDETATFIRMEAP